MKILFINRGMSFYRGGGENFDLNIAGALEKLGCEIEFITGKSLTGKIRYPVKEFKTTYLRTPYLRDLSQKLKKGSGYVNLLDRKLFAKRVIDYLKNRKENFILQVCSIPEVVEIKKFREIPVVIRFPGPPWKKDDKWIKKFDKIIASGDTVRVIRENFREDVVDIPPGVDTEIFKKTQSDIREKYDLKNKRVLIFTGRLVPIKNIPFLIQAMKKLPSDTVLLIVGDGPLKNELKRKVEKENLVNRIIFTGYIPQEKLSFYYSAGDIFVLSSFYDNLPNSVLEAMASELPVVAPSVGGVPIIVKNGTNGYLYSSGDLEEFVERVKLLLENSSLREKIGKENRKKIIENFNWKKSAEKLKELYEQLFRKAFC